jgi:hypothetical protein
MHRTLFRLSLWLAFVAFATALSGCHSLKDVWDSRGIPPQSEPQE